MNLAQIAQKARGIKGTIEADKLARYDWTFGMDEFHKSQERLRLLRAPNQCGKTIAGCAEDWWFLTNTHPFRKRAPGPVILWVLLADLENQYREFCEKLYSLEPPGVLADGCAFITGKGYFFGGARQIVLKDGSRVAFRSGKGEKMALASGTAHALHVDEPPFEEHYLEAQRAVYARQGPIWVTLTPVNRPCEWLKKKVEGEVEKGVAPSEKWAQFVPELSETALTTTRKRRKVRSKDSIEAQFNANRGTARFPQVCLGAWEGASEGALFSGFLDDKHTLPISAFQDIDLDFLRSSFDWGESTATQIGLVLGFARKAGGLHIYVLSEIQGVDGHKPEDDARDFLHELDWLGISLEQVQLIRGDINSGGKEAGGRSVNSLFAAGLRKHRTDLHEALFPPVERPNKKAGSVCAGERLLAAACADGRLFISDRCPNLRKALRYYTGGEEDLKHVLDALRYGTYDLLTETSGQSTISPGVVSPSADLRLR